MKTTVYIIVLVVCIMVVGYIEDPCTTEGLAKGFMDGTG